MSGRTHRVSSTDMQRKIGLMIDTVRAGDVVMVESHGRRIIVLLSVAEYDRLCEAARQLAREDDHVRGD